MKRNPFTGDCMLCGAELAKAGVTRHLSACPSRPTAGRTAFHVVVESAEYKDFWLHTYVSATARLATLDAFLRATWLECCGHLSSFEIGGWRFESFVDRSGWGPRARTMGASLDSVFAAGSKFKYEYD